MHSFLDENGARICYNQNLTRQFTSEDGGDNWTETSGPNAGGVLSGRVRNCERLAGGDLLVDNRTGGLIRLSPDGTAQPFAVSKLDEAVASGEETWIIELSALSENRLFLAFGCEVTSSESDSSESHLYSISFTSFYLLIDLESGETITEFQTYPLSHAVNEDTLYLIDGNGGVTVHALADGKPHPVENVSIGFDESLQTAYGQNGLLFLTSKSILELSAEALSAGGEASVLVGGGSYAFANPNTGAAALHALPSGALVVLLESESGAKMYRYQWDENAGPPAGGTLTIWSLEDMPIVRSAIATLNNQGLDVAVEYEAALAEGGITAEDAIRTLNTRLLSGYGPDVLILDGCPAESYAARGLLQNLDGLVDTGGMFPSIVAPFATETGMFMLPAGVKIPVLMGDPAMLEKAATLQQLLQMVQDGLPLRDVYMEWLLQLEQDGQKDNEIFSALPEEELPVLSPETLREVYDLLWNSSAESIVTTDGLDTAALRVLLQTLAAISEKYELNDGFGVDFNSLEFSTTGRSVQSTLKGMPMAYFMIYGRRLRRLY